MAELKERIDAARNPRSHVILLAWLICDGCGWKEPVSRLGMLPEGWILGEHGEECDFCPGCSRDV